MNKIILLIACLGITTLNFAQEIEVLDSTHSNANNWITNTTIPDVYTYHLADAQGRDTQVIFYRYDADEGLHYLNEKQSLVYNNNGKIESTVRWIYYTDKFYPEAKTEYTYTINGLVEKMTTYRGSGSNWEEDQKVEYQYNTNDSLTEMALYNFEAGNWSLFSQQIIKFNGNNRSELIDLGFNFSLQEIDTNTHIYYTYQNGLLQEKLNRNIDFSTNNLVDALHDSFYYDNKNRNLARTQKIYDAFGKRWIYILADSFTYPAANEIVKVQYGNFGQWTPSLKEHRYTNTNGNDTLILTSYWDFIAGSFSNNSRRIFRFNSSGKPLYQLSESFDTDLNVWILQNEKTYYYSKKSTVGMPQKNSAEVKLHYNGKNLMVSANKNIKLISVYTINGQLLARVSANETSKRLEVDTKDILIIYVSGTDWNWVDKHCLIAY
ncbi:MAG: hypothetical protein KDC92_14355 [Bacteroidetes bacterium]|nr:hypothetical protein [Bacteroidota bacterium]